MLDFYLIRDNQPIPNYPEQANLEIAGGLDYETYEYLKSKGLIDKRLDFYSDFFWGTEMIESTLAIINQGGFKSDPRVKLFYDLISLALEKKCGLIAYSD